MKSVLEYCVLFCTAIVFFVIFLLIPMVFFAGFAMFQLGYLVMLLGSMIGILKLKEKKP